MSAKGSSPAPDLVSLPPRFRVDVRKLRLIGLVVKEFFQMRGNAPAALSRPCVYGVFSGPLGGLRPNEYLCVGCLRCTVQYPEVVQIRPNPARASLGDMFLQPSQVETILYEARRGRVPVRGAGYRGPFGGEGWDGMWLDMSEIVRPTRDGIHGREFISTTVDIGSTPKYLAFAPDGSLASPQPRLVSLEVPFFFDAPPSNHPRLQEALSQSAQEIGTAAVLPVSSETEDPGPHLVPLLGELTDEVLFTLGEDPPMLALDGWDVDRFELLRRRFPESIVWVRIPADNDVLELVERGVSVVHLIADYDGSVGDTFIEERIRQAHTALVDAGLREQVTLVGSGGVFMAEHVAKAIASGLDAVGLDLAVFAALQFDLSGEGRADAELHPPDFDVDWATKRLVNLTTSWRDQLLEVLGAMGMREVRRLRGETGRIMFQRDLEQEAFAEIEGYAV